MTLGIKDMIARCIAKLRQGDCATCENRDSCAIHKLGAFAPPPAEAGLAKAIRIEGFSQSR